MDKETRNSYGIKEKHTHKQEVESNITYKAYATEPGIIIHHTSEKKGNPKCKDIDTLDFSKNQQTPRSSIKHQKHQ